MKKILMSLLIALIICGCTTTHRNQKTPQTTIGQINSCMLREIYNRHDSNRLKGEKWTIAQEVLTHCLHRLNTNNPQSDYTQSINIAVSVIESLR